MALLTLQLVLCTREHTAQRSRQSQLLLLWGTFMGPSPVGAHAEADGHLEGCVGGVQEPHDHQLRQDDIASGADQRQAKD